MEKEIGRIEKGEYQGTKTEIVVGIKEYNNRMGVDIREFNQSETYTGPTKKGLRIPADKFEEFKSMINSINSSDLVGGESAAPVSVAAESVQKPLDGEDTDDAGVADDGTI